MGGACGAGDVDTEASLGDDVAEKGYGRRTGGLPSRGDDEMSITGFLGGSPAAVALRLLVVSFVAGMILVAFGFEPESLYSTLMREVRRIIEFGWGDVRQIARILITGAMVVLPIWLLLRVLDARRAR